MYLWALIWNNEKKSLQQFFISRNYIVSNEMYMSLLYQVDKETGHDLLQGTFAAFSSTINWKLW
jgi:hypothetical protein